MKRILVLILLGACFAAGGRVAAGEGHQFGRSLPIAQPPQNGFVIVPDATNAIRFRIFTDATPDAPRLFNTFEIEGYGDLLLQSPAGESLRQWRAAKSSAAALHNVLVDGVGPELSAANSMTLTEQAAGPNWAFVALDASRAYRGRLEQYRRGILFVAPDLLVLHDHVVAKNPVSFQMRLHPPAATRLDPIWRDLSLERPQASLRIHAPSRRELRAWERVESPADALLPGTLTVQLGPTNQVAQLDLLTVFAVKPTGKPTSYAFKLVESNTATGARIHRDGLPTLVAFRLDPTNASPSLDGYGFTGPVGVAEFVPKRSLR